MNEIIRKRKSIRKYDLTPLDSETLNNIKDYIKHIKPLYPDIRYSIEITNKTAGIFNIKAPHYLIFGSEEKEGAYENIGFIGQQIDLYLSESGLGACWLGASKPEDKENSALPFVICTAFGKANEPLHRELSDFKRKPLTEISDGSDERLEAARLAPSATNSQNWYFSARDGKIRCYRKKTKPLIAVFYKKLNSIDMGIALCHIASESNDFNYLKETGVPEIKGHVYMGTVKGNTL
ncbi:MAG: nitroreductase [Lachnospiraceae bacterium]|nr:nitroreductase [Lachnospiraceae bacterium]